MMTKEEMNATLASMGLKKIYKPFTDNDNTKDIICLTTRKPAKIIDGIMHGSDIDLYDNNTFRVWTSHKNKAIKAAKDNNFKIRPLDGEAELFIPVSRADEFLHSFGAKVKANRKVHPKTIEALKLYHANKRLAG
jgi:hypothetical protein